MMLSRYKLFAAIFILLVASVGVGYRYITTPKLPPICRFPADLNLLDYYYNEIALCEIPIQNEGESNLILERFQTSCSCAEVQAVIDGTTQKISRLEIPPNQKFNLIVPIHVIGKTGMPQTVSLTCNTNDPAKPTIRATIVIPKVKDKPRIYPRSIVFGAIKKDSAATQRLLVYDNEVVSQDSPTIKPSQVTPVSATVVPVKENGAIHVDPSFGKLIATIEEVVNTKLIGPFSCDIFITFPDVAAQSYSINVSGEVTP